MSETITQNEIETIIKDMPDIPPIIRNPDGTFAKGSVGQNKIARDNSVAWRRNMCEAFKKCISRDDFEAVCKVLLKKALKGDRYCIQEILDRCLGKNDVNISITSEDVTWTFKYDLTKEELQKQDTNTKIIDCDIIDSEKQGNTE